MVGMVLVIYLGGRYLLLSWFGCLGQVFVISCLEGFFSMLLESDRFSLGVLWFRRVVFCLSEFYIRKIRVKILE